MTIERQDPESGIKVVPMYLAGDENPDEASVEEDAAPVEDSAAPADRARTPLLGILALGLGLLTVAALVTGIVVASGRDWRLATVIAYGAIGLSVLAFVAGVVALILGRGRRWAVVGVLVGVVANPLVLLGILRFFGGFEAG